MANKSTEIINGNIEFYKNYFKEELEAVDEELEKSKKYSEIIDKEIDKLSMPALGANKGGQHYLIEHINNAVQLQTQRQSLRKDKFTIKKSILDYAAKFAEDAGSSEEKELAVLIEELLNKDKKEKIETVNIVNDVDLDAEIDKAINGEN